MDEILKSLAQHAGIDVATARNGLGAVVMFLKDHLPEGLSGQLMGALPGSHDVAASYEENKTGGGIMGAVTGLASKALGGGGGAGDASKLMGMLSKSGLSLTQVQAFLPKAIELLKQHVPPDLADKIAGLLQGALAGGKTA